MNSGKGDGGSIRSARTFLVLLLIVPALAYSLYQSAYVRPGSERARERFFTISFAVTFENSNSEGEVWTFSEDDTGVGLFMNSSWQTAYLKDVSCPIERIETDRESHRHGNTIASMSFPKSRLNPGENLSYQVSYRIVLKARSAPEMSESDSETLRDIPEDLRGLYCVSTGPWQVTDSGLRDLAYEVAGNETKVLTIVRKFIEWSRDHISYSTLDVARYPNETYLLRAGDCDDQANLLITLCRILGIPAYLQIGGIYLSDYTENAYWNGIHWRLTRIAWHGWAVVYVPPWGWLPVDITYPSRSNLRADPLNAIRMSSIMTDPTVQLCNYSKTDYIAASRDHRDFLQTHDFYIYRHDIMSEETAE